MILADVSTAVEVCDARDDDPGCGRRVQKTFHAGKKCGTCYLKTPSNDKMDKLKLCYVILAVVFAASCSSTKTLRTTSVYTQG